MPPTVHLNGTSRKALFEQHVAAAQAVRVAREVHAESAPHGRDYYLQGPTAYREAQLEYLARDRKLAEVCEELMKLAEAIGDE